jgi:hypothetical protein
MMACVILSFEYANSLNLKIFHFSRFKTKKSLVTVKIYILSAMASNRSCHEDGPRVGQRYTVLVAFTR